MIRSSQEADVDLIIDQKSPAGSLIHGMNPDELSSLFLTSRVHLHDVGADISGRFEQGTELGSGMIIDTKENKCRIHMFTNNLYIEQTPCRIVARTSSKHKCPRCWNYHANQADTLCPRCTHVLQQ